MSKSRFEQTVELLSQSYTSGDLWDELNRELSPEQLILYPKAGITYSLRLLGPFVGVERLYVPRKSLRQYLSNNEIHQLIHTKSDISTSNVLKAIGFDSSNNRNIRNMLKNIYNDKMSPVELDASRPIIDILQFLYKLLEDKSRTQCIMVNSLCMVEGQRKSIQVVSLTIPIITSLFKLSAEMSETLKIKPENVVINGLYAHDIFLKRDARNKGNIQVEINKQSSYLSTEDMEFILTKTLVDIPKLLDSLNESDSHSYIYSKNINYGVSRDVMLGMMDSYNIKLENEHYQVVEDADPRLLPRNAFEESEQIDNSIGYLEL